MPPFLDVQPSPEDCWRAIVLLGRNVASYKFALAKSLIEFAKQETSFVSLEELAVPFSKHICEHLGKADKQGIAKSSAFLAACRGRLRGDVSDDELIGQTVKLGFQNVIDAFHNVSRKEVPFRFFTDERKSNRKGIALTDDLLRLTQGVQIDNFPNEAEARWRLVETAWEMDIAVNLIVGQHGPDGYALFRPEDSLKRVPVTSCRDALN